MVDYCRRFPCIYEEIASWWLGHLRVSAVPGSLVHSLFLRYVGCSVQRYWRPLSSFAAPLGQERRDEGEGMLVA